MARPFTLAFAFVCLGALVYAGFAQDAGSGEEAMDEMMGQIEENPLIEPVAEPDDATAPPRLKLDVDPNIIGVAPGGEAPKLRREGESVIARRGRMVRHPDGAHMLFVFEADDQQSPEPPMILVPCQLLQNMEDITSERGDQVTFIITGQVLTYRNANYLLPTVMKLTVDRGNLR